MAARLEEQNLFSMYNQMSRGLSTNTLFSFGNSLSTKRHLTVKSSIVPRRMTDRGGGMDSQSTVACVRNYRWKVVPLIPPHVLSNYSITDELYMCRANVRAYVRACGRAYVWC